MFYWFVSIAALVGVWLNIKKHVACFWIWAGTNAVWAYVDAIHGIWPQAALQMTYFLLSVSGVFSWGSKKNKRLEVPRK